MIPRASIIIPAYNAEEHVQQTLHSVLAQSEPGFECIVVDDGSTDGTVHRVREIRDPRIKLICTPNSGGPARPRNIGIAASTGRYVFLFDSDDLMEPDKVATAIDALDRHDSADFLFTNFRSIDDNGTIIKPDFLREYATLYDIVDPAASTTHFIRATELHPALVQVNFIGTSSVVLRRAALSRHDVFDESLRNSDDRLFWLRFSRSHNALFIDRLQHSYRVRLHGISKQSFIRRGPSKIRALEIALEECPDPALRAVLNRQIAQDYVSLAYAYKTSGSYGLLFKSALESVKRSPSLKGLKLLAAGLLLRGLDIAQGRAPNR